MCKPLPADVARTREVRVWYEYHVAKWRACVCWRMMAVAERGPPVADNASAGLSNKHAATVETVEAEFVVVDRVIRISKKFCRTQYKVMVWLQRGLLVRTSGVHIIRLPLLLRVSPAACTRTPSGSARSVLRHERPSQLLSSEIMTVVMVCGLVAGFLSWRELPWESSHVAYCLALQEIDC